MRTPRMSTDQVTPNIEHCPERTYKRTGAVITCFQAVRAEGLWDDVTLGNELYSFEMISEDIAIKLMQDLYYGEYTGS